jgi:tetratricopeptide (TPR) repeat protein
MKRITRAVVSMTLAWLVGAGAAAVTAAGQGTPASDDLQAAEAQLARAEASYERAAVQGAIDRFRGLMAKHPKDARYPYFLARAYFPLVDLYEHQGDAATAEKLGEEGLELARKAVELDPSGNPDAYRVLGDFYGRLTGFKGIFARMRYGGRSFKHHKTALEMDPRSARALIGDGADKLNAPRGFGGDVPGALASFKKASELEPASARPHVWMGRAYVKLEQYDLARQSFQKAVDLDPKDGFARLSFDQARKTMSSN